METFNLQEREFVFLLLYVTQPIHVATFMFFYETFVGLLQIKIKIQFNLDVEYITSSTLRGGGGAVNLLS